jgi:ribonucleoside-diphosphate reductase alpha chain
MSVPDAIGLALEEWMKMKQGVQQELLSSSVELQAIQPEFTLKPESVKVRSTSGGTEQAAMFEASGGGGEAFIGTCPDCGSQLEFAEGCAKCHVCGFSECG